MQESGHIVIQRAADIREGFLNEYDTGEQVARKAFEVDWMPVDADESVFGLCSLGEVEE